MEMIHVVLALLLWIAPIFVGWSIGDKKGRSGLGFVLGFFLGWIGVIIIACLSDLNEKRAESAKVDRQMVMIHQQQKQIEMLLAAQNREARKQQATAPVSKPADRDDAGTIPTYRLD